MAVLVLWEPDGETLSSGTVTVRERDAMTQVRVAEDHTPALLEELGRLQHELDERDGQHERLAQLSRDDHGGLLEHADPDDLRPERDLPALGRSRRRLEGGRLHRRDRERPISPLVMAEGAFLIDSTDLTIEQVIGQVMDSLRRCGLAEPSQGPSVH